MTGHEATERTLSRRELRHRQTRDEILDAAWTLARRDGLAGLTLRDLGREVGMKAQSLYSYFGSKHDIYDAMFHQGYEAFAEALGLAGAPEQPAAPVGPDNEEARDLARRAVRGFVTFCTEDPARYQLLFLRTIPGFEPSPESYALALAVFDAMSEQLAAIGVSEPAAVDLWSAVTTGLASQQIANDPGGDRWARLIDRAVDMLLRETVGAGQPANPNPEP